MFYPKFKNPSKITLKELVDKDILNEEELTMTVENMELESTLYKHLKEPVSFTGGNCSIMYLIQRSKELYVPYSKVQVVTIWMMMALLASLSAIL